MSIAADNDMRVDLSEKEGYVPISVYFKDQTNASIYNCVIGNPMFSNGMGWVVRIKNFALGQIQLTGSLFVVWTKV